MSEAAKMLGVSNHAIRRLIKAGGLAAAQVVPGAPYQIRATDLRNEAASRPSSPGKVACVASIPKTNFQCLQTLENGVHNECLIALGRKAWLFAGSDRGANRAAVMCTLIMTAKLNGVDPQAWLADVFTRIASLPQGRLHELLPWEGKKLRLPMAA